VVVGVLIRRCLQREVRRRLRDIGDARTEIEEAVAGAGGDDGAADAAALKSSARRWKRAPAALALLLTIVSALALIGREPGPQAPPRAISLSVVPPSGSYLITEEYSALAVSVGPFAHVRMGATLEDTVKVGNFVEIKKSKLGRGPKSGHLAYLGDATVGKNVNVSFPTFPTGPGPRYTIWIKLSS
jgi:hypothetical protein